MNKYIQILLSIICLVILSISARSCVNRSKTKSGSSNNNAFMINAPTNLIASAISSSQINLTWQDNSNNEDGFAIERKEWAGGTWIEITRVNANVISYSDTALVPFITYYYRVYAFNMIGDRSNYSNEANATTSFSVVWSMIAMGEFHTIGLANNGTIWGWGNNGVGQLGLGDFEDRTTASLIGVDTDWSLVGAGYYHSFAIKSNSSAQPPADGGTLWAWGANEGGELGLGDTNDRDTPVLIGTASDWSLVDGGSWHTVARKTNGTIYSWGFNGNGQLGLGDTIDRNTPSQIGTDTEWTGITAGDFHTLALKTDGTLWAWGQNWYGQLGVGMQGSFDARNTPVQVGSYTGWAFVNAGNVRTDALKLNGTIWRWGVNIDGTGRETPFQIGTETD